MVGEHDATRVAKMAATNHMGARVRYFVVMKNKLNPSLQGFHLLVFCPSRAMTASA
jgi:hypothetical protein